jgi:hypothetical protein
MHKSITSGCTSFNVFLSRLSKFSKAFSKFFSRLSPPDTGVPFE